MVPRGRIAIGVFVVAACGGGLLASCSSKRDEGTATTTQPAAGPTPATVPPPPKLEPALAATAATAVFGWTADSNRLLVVPVRGEGPLTLGDVQLRSGDQTIAQPIGLMLRALQVTPKGPVGNIVTLGVMDEVIDPAPLPIGGLRPTNDVKARTGSTKIFMPSGISYPVGDVILVGEGLFLAPEGDSAVFVSGGSIVYVLQSSGWRLQLSSDPGAPRKGVVLPKRDQWDLLFVVAAALPDPLILQHGDKRYPVQVTEGTM